MNTRCYTVKQLLEKLGMKRSTFHELRLAGKIPFLEELRPRLGRSPRFRADRLCRINHSCPTNRTPAQ